jgi:protein SCO1/2
MAGVVLAIGLGAWAASGATAEGSLGPPPQSIGVTTDRELPPSLADMTFENQSGHRVTLQQSRGRAVFLVPFLTSCQEECPLTTGALLSVERRIKADHLGSRVVVAGITVDPERDSPARMAAYARLTGCTWSLWTSTNTSLAQFWRFFGVYYQKVPEGSPPGIDWQTGQPYTYDVDHSDGFIVLDTRLRERFIAGGMVRVASVPARVRGLLDAQGLANLRHPGGGSWSVTDALEAIGWVLGISVGTPS